MCILLEAHREAECLHIGGMRLTGKRHKHENNKREIGDTSVGNHSRTHHCLFDFSHYNCSPDAAVASRGTDAANVPAPTMAAMAGARTGKAGERTPTEAAMATTGAGQTNERPPTVAYMAATGTGQTNQ